MSIENFFTTRSFILPAQAQSVAQGKVLPGGQAQGVNFLDFILAQINPVRDEAQSAGKTAVQNTEDGPLQSDNKLLEKKPELNVAELLAANPEIEEELKDFIESTQLDPEAALTQVLRLNQQAFDNVLKPLTDGIITTAEIAEGSPRILQAFLIEQPQDDSKFIIDINTLKEKIESILEEGGPELIALNLTPEQLDIARSLSEVAPLPPELQDNPFATLVQMIAPVNQPETEAVSFAQEIIQEINEDPALQNLVAILLPPTAQPQPKAQQTLDTTLPPQASSQAYNQMEILAMRLNNLSVGGSTPPPAEGEALFTLEDYEGNLQPSQDGKGQSKGGNNAAFEALMNAESRGNTTPAPSPDLSVLQNWPFPAGSTLFSAFEFGQELTDQYGLNTTSSAPSTLGTLTSAITQAQSAANAHPATQMVAVTLQKAAGAGENKTLTLQLEPPELGRVQVKMTFGADKTVKAVLLSEKPETHMMLQRDAQTLERALQGIELDSDGGLQFELAEHGFDFDQNNQRGGGHDRGGTGAGEDADGVEESIETTMTWQVDPETGHMRYDIVA
ncbi:MAG TPA: flagellar hook-length control protein FliK [Alphaproteobacteria bacterium]|nr:MAG: flagellar hook-length control protein FliK [Rhodospirillales bacterium]HOO82287.1 flagellar hook-length control protein FliK [Alphaproteobacteria bacterium]